MNLGRARNFGRNSCSPGGRSSGSGGNSADRLGPIGADGSSSGAPFGNKDRLFVPGRQTSGKMPVGNMSKSTSCYPNQQDCPLPGIEAVSSDLEKLKLMQNSPVAEGCSLKQLECLSASVSEFQKDFPSLSDQSDLRDKHQAATRTQSWQTLDSEAGGTGSLHFDRSPVIETSCVQNEPSILAESGIKGGLSKKGSQCKQISHEIIADNGNTKNSECLAMGVPYDICTPRSKTLVTLKPPLLMKNREKRNELKRSTEGKNIIVLRSGMVVLKSYISCNDQVRIVKKCREIGLGAGGFYQPGYRDGAQLHLKMMCLGMNWDPETSKYGDQRPIDGAKPPVIPDEFHQLVKKAIQDSHAFLEKKSKAKVEDILPSMSPNICIVNFYTTSGRLGLHQDKDESPESLLKALPVVSFSIGDSAEFLYSDQRDPDKADKVILESGDVLIFGGKSRHVFHGVTAIVPNTAPRPLLTETDLRPGRLNLTFREY